MKRLSLLIVGLLLLAAPGASDAAKKRTATTPAPHKSDKAGGQSAEPAEEDTSSLKRGERIEFDERLIQGQTAKAGALYLFDRKPSDLRSMVHERESYRDEMVQQVFPQEAKP